MKQSLLEGLKMNKNNMKPVNSESLAKVLLLKVMGHRSEIERIPAKDRSSKLVRRLKRIQVIDSLEHRKS